VVVSRAFGVPIRVELPAARTIPESTADGNVDPASHRK
jgi:hypothetical protein